MPTMIRVPRAERMTKTPERARTGSRVFAIYRDCSGALSDGAHSAQVRFSARVDPRTRIAIRCRPIPLGADNSWLLRAHESPGPLLDYLVLKGATAEDEPIRSNTVVVKVRRHSTPRDGTLRITGHARELEIDSRGSAVETPPTNAQIAYYLVGARGFEQCRSATEAGRALFHAESQPKWDRISGYLVFDTPPEALAQSTTRWLAKSDEVADRMLDILSLGAGRPVEWCARRVFLGPDQLRLTYRSLLPHGRGAFPIFHWVHLPPIFTMAAERYSETVRSRTGMDMAIRWFLLHGVYAEANYLSTFMALEHLVDRWQAHTYPRRRVSDAVFGDVRAELKSTLKDCFESLKESDPAGFAAERVGIGRIRDALKTLNDPSFEDRLMAFLQESGVPADDLKDAIPELIQLRNRIVHARRFTRADSMAASFLVLRELVARSFLALLNFEGQYESYYEGPRTRQFSRTPDAPPLWHEQLQAEIG